MVLLSEVFMGGSRAARENLAVCKTNKRIANDKVHGGLKRPPYNAEDCFYAVQTVRFVGGYEPRPYDAEVYFDVVKTVRGMGGHRSRPYEVRFLILDVGC